MNLSTQRTDFVSERIGHLQAIPLVCVLAFALVGCSSTSLSGLIDSLPSSVGLPADAPERPATAPAYPAVHDMPPARANTTLTAEEQVQLENELLATRNRQEALAGTGSAPRKRTQPAASPAAPRVIPTSSSNSIY